MGHLSLFYPDLGGCRGRETAGCWGAQLPWGSEPCALGRRAGSVLSPGPRNWVTATLGNVCHSLGRSKVAVATVQRQSSAWWQQLLKAACSLYAFSFLSCSAPGTLSGVPSMGPGTPRVGVNGHCFPFQPRTGVGTFCPQLYKLALPTFKENALHSQRKHYIKKYIKFTPIPTTYI